MIRNTILHIALMVILCSCDGNSGRDRKFDRIDTMADTEPGKALEMLDSIDYGSLTERERHRHDLLTIKSRDKAYIRHTSDSLILDVIGYYESHRDKKLYPMALYYGGRVYADMGDYPTALQYFQNAIDIIPDDKENILLRGVALSQTGRLLNDLRLYKQSIPYIKEAIGIHRAMDNSFNLSYDNQMLSSVFLNVRELDSATYYAHEAIKYSSDLPDSDRANLKIGLAAVLYEKGEIDSALAIIRPVVNETDSICHNYALAKASRIYRAAGITDTAYMYAHELAMARNQDNRKTGFQILFSSELENMVPKDSLLSYVPKYKALIEGYLNTHEAEEALIQNSKYNYLRHLTDKEKAEKAKHRMLIILITALLLTASIWVVFWRRHKAADKLSRVSGHSDDRARNLDDIVSILKDENLSLKVADPILQSETYALLKQLIKDEECIPEFDKTLADIERLVRETSPSFKPLLEKFTNGKLTDLELEIALLMKCGFSTSQMAVLLSRATNTISTRRKSLFEKIFKSKQDISILPNFILYLGSDFNRI